MLSDEMRKLLLHGPGRPPSHANLLKYGGSATLLVQWRKHRQELLDACPIGSRPWAFFAIERRFRVVPRLEADQSERSAHWVAIATRPRLPMCGGGLAR